MLIPIASCGSVHIGCRKGIRMHRISVVVPVYNVMPYLRDCLTSLQAQTYTEIEFLLVDDGSRDGSGALCDEFASRDARFRVLHQQNAGVSAARNAGLTAATGDLIAFADGDDWVDPDIYTRLAKRLAGENADAAMCGYYEYVPAPRTTFVRSPGHQETDGPRDALFWVMTRNGYFTAIWNKLFRREIIGLEQGKGTFDPSLGVGEDEVWLLQALARCRRVAYDPAPLYHWRSRPDSASRLNQLTDRHMSILKSKRQAIDIVRPFGADLEELGQSRMLNDSFYLKVLAYRAGDNRKLAEIRTALRPMRSAWLRSRDVPWLRKGKVLLVDVLLVCHAPSAWVDALYDVKRTQANS